MVIHGNSFQNVFYKFIPLGQSPPACLVGDCSHRSLPCCLLLWSIGSCAHPPCWRPRALWHHQRHWTGGLPPPPKRLPATEGRWGRRGWSWPPPTLPHRQPLLVCPVQLLHGHPRLLNDLPAADSLVQYLRGHLQQPI